MEETSQIVQIEKKTIVINCHIEANERGDFTLDYEEILDFLLWNHRPPKLADHGFLFGDYDLQLNLVTTIADIFFTLLPSQYLDELINKVSTEAELHQKSGDLEFFAKTTADYLKSPEGRSNFKLTLRRKLEESPRIITTHLPPELDDIEQKWISVIVKNSIEQTIVAGSFRIIVPEILEECMKNYNEDYHGRLIKDVNLRTKIIVANACEWRSVFFSRAADEFVNNVSEVLAVKAEQGSLREVMRKCAVRCMSYFTTDDMKKKFRDFISKKVGKHPEYITTFLGKEQNPLNEWREWRSNLFMNQMLRCYEKGDFNIDIDAIHRTLKENWLPQDGIPFTDEKVQRDMIKFHVHAVVFNYFSERMYDSEENAFDSIINPTYGSDEHMINFTQDCARFFLAQDKIQKDFQKYLDETVISNPEIIGTYCSPKSEDETVNIETWRWRRSVVRNLMTWAHVEDKLGVDKEEFYEELCKNRLPYHGTLIGDREDQLLLTDVMISIHTGLYSFEGPDEIIRQVVSRMSEKEGGAVLAKDIESFAEETTSLLSSKEFTEAYKERIYERLVLCPDMISTRSPPHNSAMEIRRESRKAVFRACISYAHETNVFGFNYDMIYLDCILKYYKPRRKSAAIGEIKKQLAKLNIIKYSKVYFAEKMDLFYDEILKLIPEEEEDVDPNDFASAVFRFLEREEIKKNQLEFIKRSMAKRPELMETNLDPQKTEMRQDSDKTSVFQRQLLEAHERGDISVDYEMILDELLRTQEKHHGRLIGDRENLIELIKVNVQLQLGECDNEMVDEHVSCVEDNLQRISHKEKSGYFEFECFIFLKDELVQASYERFVWSAITKRPQIISSIVVPKEDSNDHPEFQLVEDQRLSIIGSNLTLQFELSDLREALDSIIKGHKESDGQLIGNKETQLELLTVLYGVQLGVFFSEGNDRTVDRIILTMTEDERKGDIECFARKALEYFHSDKYYDHENRILRKINPKNLASSNSKLSTDEKCQIPVFRACVRFANRSKALGFDVEKLLEETIKKYTPSPRLVFRDREKQLERIKRELRKQNVKYYTDASEDFVSVVTAMVLDAFGEVKLHLFARMCFHFLSQQSDHRKSIWEKITSDPSYYLAVEINASESDDEECECTSSDEDDDLSNHGTVILSDDEDEESSDYEDEESANNEDEESANNEDDPMIEDEDEPMSD